MTGWTGVLCCFGYPRFLIDITTATLPPDSIAHRPFIMPRATQASQRASSSRSATAGRHVDYDEPPPTRGTATYSRKGKRPAAVMEDDDDERPARAGPSGTRNGGDRNTQARANGETDAEDDDEDGGSPGPNGTAVAPDKKSAEAKAREAMGNEVRPQLNSPLARLTFGLCALPGLQ